MKSKILYILLIFVLMTSFLSSCTNINNNNNSNINNPHCETDRFIPNNHSSVYTEESENENSNEGEENSVESDTSEESSVVKNKKVSFLACPDNIIHPSVFYDAIERAAKSNNCTPDFSDLHSAKYDFAPIYKNVAQKIAEADIAYINQETLIGGTSGKIIGYPCFNSPESVADTVSELGFDVVNVAHNHMLDSKNATYLENCFNVFNSKGLEVIGYYPRRESTEDIVIIENNGIEIALLAYTYGTNGLRLPSESTVIIPYFSKELVTKQVILAKQISDVVIVSCHWGYEDTFDINSQQKEYAELMCELGVDVIIGMHPHVIQPMEWKYSVDGHKTLVVYSLGNFVSGMVNGKNMLAGMLSFDILKDSETGITSIENPLFIPIVTHYTKQSRVASNDTGYRNFEIFYLNDYTENLAASHGVFYYERHHSPTLIGGKFSKENLLATLYEYIPMEFLPKNIIKNRRVCTSKPFTSTLQ